MKARPSYIKPMHGSRLLSPVALKLTLSVFLLRFSGATLCFFFEDAGDAVPEAGGAGEEVPFDGLAAAADGFGLPAPPFFCLFTSSLHLATIWLASDATLGSLCVRNLLMVTPILVCLKRSSVGFRPVLRSLRSLIREGLGSFSAIALLMALPWSSTPLTSTTMVADSLGRGSYRGSRARSWGGRGRANARRRGRRRHFLLCAGNRADGAGTAGSRKRQK